MNFKIILFESMNGKCKIYLLEVKVLFRCQIVHVFSMLRLREKKEPNRESFQEPWLHVLNIRKRKI